MGEDRCLFGGHSLMAWWQWLVGILLFIVALGVLIGIHELGHLGAAKLFHVYCYDYSIGFGPALIKSKRTEKRETTWTLRAIPLGGFVAMYGEGMQDDEAGYIPMSRSLEGIARYKRAIIISAGVFLNFILGFILIFIHNAAFDQRTIFLNASTNNYSYFIQATVTPDTYDMIKDGDGIALELEPLQKVSVSGSNSQKTSFYIIDDDVVVNKAKYVLGVTGVIPELNDDPDLNLSLSLYAARPYEDVINAAEYNEDNFCTVWMRNDGIAINEENVAIYKDKIAQLPDKVNSYKEQLRITYKDKMQVTQTIDPTAKYNIASDTPDEIGVDINYFASLDGGYAPVKTSQSVTLKLNDAKNGWQKLGIAYKRYIWHYNAGESFKVSWDEWCQSNSMIFVALGKIFTGDISSLGGPVAIATVSSQALANFGFGNYLNMWGMISCNLAIINLLPFPGLDGWSLVVIGYEAISKKQIPTKVKGMISVLGLVLLFGLMILILIKDVIGLAGI